jgi:hypothetical protein
MSSLTGSAISATYDLLLKIADTGIGASLKAVEDGDGDTSALSISETQIQVSGAAAFSGTSGTFVTFDGSDTTPTVAAGNLFKTAGTPTITTFDDGLVGQTIVVISTGAVIFAVSGNLQAGSTNITTAANDVTQWVYDGTNWYLLSWMDDSENLSGAGGF